MGLSFIKNGDCSICIKMDEAGPSTGLNFSFATPLVPTLLKGEGKLVLEGRWNSAAELKKEVIFVHGDEVVEKAYLLD